MRKAILYNGKSYKYDMIGLRIGKWCDDDLFITVCFQFPFLGIDSFSKSLIKYK